MSMQEVKEDKVILDIGVTLIKCPEIVKINIINQPKQLSEKMRKKLGIPAYLTYEEWIQKEIDKKKALIRSNKERQVYRMSDNQQRKKKMRADRFNKIKDMVVGPSKHKNLVKKVAKNGLIDYDCSYELVMGFEESRHLWSID